MASTLAEETTDLSLPELRQRRPLPKRVVRRARQARLAARVVPGWEWAIAVVTLLVLTRSPVLFYRERIGELVGAGRAFYI